MACTTEGVITHAASFLHPARTQVDKLIFIYSHPPKNTSRPEPCVAPGLDGSGDLSTIKFVDSDSG